jgi:ubiquinol-cytochrome c reductase cytochrome c subunit
MSSRGRSQLLLPLAVAGAVTGLILLGSGVLAGPARPTAVGQVEVEENSQLTTLEAEGRLLYLRDCSWCHGSEGEGSIYGPGLQGVGAASTDFMLATGRMPIDQPQEDPPPAPPAYGPKDIARMAAYVATFGEGPPIPLVEPEGGDLGDGAILYQENCAACHSSTGIGAALTSGETAPDVRDSSAIEIGEAVRIGGAGLFTGDMPRFDEQTLSDDDLDSIALYILSVLAAPDDPGGAPLNHLGPVAEGFVAVFLALPLLLLFIRWIGTTAK